ncbi:PucR family transcriptional regulator [Actinocatenispora rupis]|uniref:PucR family transcriptional regulator n=1 Tax=Actinocatenispora rupis TaxID=519421 RepID=A0A8J3NEH2_9ACTN|nr:helix-turn-helix domain-containing protein [Actinocatenispora rupis]GID13955.1 PucR family transcriptional regulator [Actinocatenispora rupis]
MIGLRWVLDALGSGLLEPVAVDTDPGVRDVVVAEPGGSDADTVHRGDLVLGIGVREVDAAVELARRCAADSAAALLLREPVAHTEQVRKIAVDGELPLVAVRGQVSWAQLVWLLRSLVDTGTVGLTARGSSEPPAFQDLFTLADAAAGVIDAPVTIEDEYSRVLAYSRRQEQADAARLSTIVGRRVPADVLRQFRSRGVFRKLGAGSEPIFVPGQPDGTMPRLIVPVRLGGGQLLGSIWALVPERPPEERVHAFADTAGVVALHLLRVRAAADVARRVAADRLTAVLAGTGPTDPRDAGLPAGPYRAVALDLADGADGHADRLLVLWESITRSRGWRRPAVTEYDGLLYAVVTEEGDTGSWPWLRRLAAELVRGEPGIRVAAGGSAPTLADLPRSAAQAAALLRLLSRGIVAGPVASHEESWAAAVLDRVTGAVPLDELTGIGPLADLLDHDGSRGGWYAETLRAYLEHPADPAAASRQLHVHPNTFRYRMRRLRGALRADLDSPDVRLALLIQLNARRLHG